MGPHVWDGIRDIGEGVRHAARSGSADTALHVLYEHQAESPGAIVHEAETNGRVTPLEAQAVART
jgi:hypothetical protein